MPTALTVAGSDSGGGAGIQADLKTFAALGVHGTSAITAVTAQNPLGVIGAQGCSPLLVRRQIDAVFAAFDVAAVKTGMLFSLPIAREVTAALREQQAMLVVDPVMVATSGAMLLKRSAISYLRDALLPLAKLVTPNVPELEVLANRSIVDEEALRAGARDLHERFGCAVLAKGGHLTGGKQAIDIFYDGKTELLLSAERVKGVETHGTGCAYSAAITGYLALGCELEMAVRMGKEFISQAIAQSDRAGRHDVLNSFWR
jgi:hydroxymethylpyrimidine/phosphomethylpyrimidine kinase